MFNNQCKKVYIHQFVMDGIFNKLHIADFIEKHQLLQHCCNHTLWFVGLGANASALPYFKPLTAVLKAPIFLLALAMSSIHLQ